MVQWVKDLALSLQQLWARNLHMPPVQPTTTTKNVELKKLDMNMHNCIMYDFSDTKFKNIQK